MKKENQKNRLKVLVKPQEDFGKLMAEVESLCTEYGRNCKCRTHNDNSSPEMDDDILF